MRMWRDRTQLESALRLYLVMDLQGHNGMQALHIAEAAIRGGVTAIQLRDKKASAERWLTVAPVIGQACRAANVLFLINDRVDLAVKLQADGVHLGQEDVPVYEARQALGPHAVVGISAGDPKELASALGSGADYLGIGPVYPTGSKADAGEAIGTSLINVAYRLNKLPVVGIGGIGPGRIQPVIRAGAAGVAVLSAIGKTADPEAAANGLWNELIRSTVNTFDVSTGKIMT